uniref:Uncharacterized protein n=1 Tax=Moniliophthora roreri TaxID=221103 RepID=A0A0W0F183_MONRR
MVHFDNFSAAERIFNDPGSWGLNERKERRPTGSLNDRDAINDRNAAGPSQTSLRKKTSTRRSDTARKRKSKPPAFTLKPFTHKHHLMPVNDGPTSDSSTPRSSDSLFDSPPPESTPESSLDSEKGESGKSSLLMAKPRTKWTGVPEDVILDQSQSLAQLLESSTSITAELFEQRMSILWSQGNIFRAFPTPKDVDFGSEGDDLISPETGIATSSFIVSSPQGHHSFSTSNSSRVAIRSSRSSSLKIPLRISTTTTTTTTTVISLNSPSPVSVTVITGSSSAYSLLELYGASPLVDGFSPFEKSKVPKTSLPNTTMFEAISHPPLPGSKAIAAPKTSHPTTTTFHASLKPPFSPHASVTAKLSAKFTRTSFTQGAEGVFPLRSSAKIVELSDNPPVSIPLPKKELPSLRIETSVPSRLDMKNNALKEIRSVQVPSKKSLVALKSPGIRPLPQPPRNDIPPPVPSLPQTARADMPPAAKVKTSAPSVPPVPSLPEAVSSRSAGMATSTSNTSRIPTRKASARLRSRSPPRATPTVPPPLPNVGKAQDRRSRPKTTDASRLRSTTPPRCSRTPKKLPPVPKLPDVGAKEATQSGSGSQPDGNSTEAGNLPKALFEARSISPSKPSDSLPAPQLPSEVLSLPQPSDSSPSPFSYQMVAIEAAGTSITNAVAFFTPEPNVRRDEPVRDKPAVPKVTIPSAQVEDATAPKSLALLEIIPPTPIIPPSSNILVDKGPTVMPPLPSLPSIPAVDNVYQPSATLRPVHKRAPSSGRLSATDHVPNPDASVLALRSRRRTASFAAGTTSSRLSDAVLPSSMNRESSAIGQVSTLKPDDKLRSSKLLSPLGAAEHVSPLSGTVTPTRELDTQADSVDQAKTLKHVRSADMLGLSGEASKTLRPTPSIEKLFDRDTTVPDRSLLARRTMKRKPSIDAASTKNVSDGFVASEVVAPLMPKMPSPSIAKDVGRGLSSWKAPSTWSVLSSDALKILPAPLRSPQRPKTNDSAADLPLQTSEVSTGNPTSPRPSSTHTPASSIEKMPQANSASLKEHERNVSSSTVNSSTRGSTSITTTRTATSPMASSTATKKTGSSESLDDLPEEVLAALARLGVRRRLSQKPVSNVSDASPKVASSSPENKASSSDITSTTPAEGTDLRALASGVPPHTHTPSSSVEKLPEGTLSSQAKRERRRAQTPPPSNRNPAAVSDMPIPPLPTSHRSSPTHTPKLSSDKPPGFDIALRRRAPTPIQFSRVDSAPDIPLPPLPAPKALSNLTHSPQASIDVRTGREYKRAPTPAHSRTPSALSDLPVPPVPLPDASVLQRRVRKPSISSSSRSEYTSAVSNVVESVSASKRFAQPTMSSAAKSVSKRTSGVPLPPLDTSSVIGGSQHRHAATPSRLKSTTSGDMRRPVNALPPPLPPKDERRGRTQARPSSPSRDRGRSVGRSAAVGLTETFASRSARSRSVGPSRDGEVLTRTRKRTSSLSAAVPPPLPSRSLAPSPVPPVPSPSAQSVVRGRVSPFPMARSTSRPPSRTTTDQGAF